MLQYVVVLTAVLAAASSLQAADPSARESDQQILVLRNGQVIEGRISQLEGVYEVDLGDGRIRVKSSDVELVCDSLQDAYRRKRAKIEIRSVHDHLDLAQWCLQNDLLEEAAAEVADAKVADPSHPMIAVVQHRLELASEPPPAEVSAERPLALPTNDELDRMIRSLPRDAVETFAQSVQPLLMRNCAVGGCHGPQSGSALRLFRLPSGGVASRRITQRNLYSVLPFIDHENPASSALLKAAAEPHGSAPHAILGNAQAEQYRRLADWASQLAQAPAARRLSSPSEADSPFFLPTPPKMLSQELQKGRPLPKRGLNRTGDSGEASPAEATRASFDEAVDPSNGNATNRRTALKRTPSEELRLLDSAKAR